MGFFDIFKKKQDTPSVEQAARSQEERRTGKDQDGTLLETGPCRGRPFNGRCRGARRPGGGAHLVGCRRGDYREDHPPHRGARRPRQVHERLGAAVDSARGGIVPDGGGPRFVRTLRARRPRGRALRGHGRRRERRRQDHDDRQARRPAYQGRAQGVAPPTPSGPQPSTSSRCGPTAPGRR